MSEMVERVARALFANNSGSSPRGKRADRAWKNYEGHARAAIEAMRDPTEEQYEALCATGLMWKDQSSQTVWQTYIDAALK